MAVSKSDERSIIEVHVARLASMFNAIDPSPFHERDLDPAAEQFIVNWTKDLPRDAPIELMVHLDETTDLEADTRILREAVCQYFAQRATTERRRLRELLRRGRTSLAIGLAFLGLSLAGSEWAGAWRDPAGMVEIALLSLLIGGWVAMWRPMEIFLYDWWPIRAEIRLFDRLTQMPVHVSRSRRSGSPHGPS